MYVSFYTPSSLLSAYPNGNSPGMFTCNKTDAFGNSGVCGQAGAQPPAPFWSVKEGSERDAAALDAAFVLGTMDDSRVGGCYNLVGEAGNRVLPCYCFFNAVRMNRTTSCDWINSQWYSTQVGQVCQRVECTTVAAPRSMMIVIQGAYWVLNFNDFKSSMLLLYSVMIVNNWHYFFNSYQIIFG